MRKIRPTTDALHYMAQAVDALTWLWLASLRGDLPDTVAPEIYPMFLRALRRHQEEE